MAQLGGADVAVPILEGEKLLSGGVEGGGKGPPIYLLPFYRLLARFPGSDSRLHLVEHPEGLPDLLLAVGVLHLPRHHGEELGEVDGAVA